MHWLQGPPTQAISSGEQSLAHSCLLSRSHAGMETGREVVDRDSLPDTLYLVRGGERHPRGPHLKSASSGRLARKPNSQVTDQDRGGGTE